MTNSGRIAVVLVLIGFSALCRPMELAAHQQLFPAPEGARMPAIAVDPDSRTWAIAWQQGRDIRLATSRDGYSFSAPKALFSGKAGGQSSMPSVAVGRAGEVSVVWADLSAKNPGVLFTRSVEGGKSFLRPRNIASKIDLPLDPKVAVDRQGRIFVVWSGVSDGARDIFLARSTDGGNSFSSPKNLSDNKHASELPAIAIDAKDRAYVVWRDKEPPTIQIWFRHSIDGGESFSKPKVVSRTGFSNTPAIAAEEDGHVYVSWVSNVAGNLDIYFIHSADAGRSFGRLLNISGTRLSSHSPSVATDGGGNVVSVWVDATPGKPEIFFRYSSDHGETFYGKKRLSSDSPSAGGPSVAAIPGKGVFVVWEDAGQNGIRFVDQEEIRAAPTE
ncbi:MAG: sialidase family protein [Candidatus Binatia bacterium]